MTRPIPGSRIASALATTALAAVLTACSSTSPNTTLAITLDASSGGQTATAGTAVGIPVKVHVTNSRGAGVSGVVVTWTAVVNGGTTATPTSTTDATGAATVAWTLDTIAGFNSMTASIASGTSVTIGANGTAGPAVMVVKVSGDNQTVPVGTNAAAVCLLLSDRYGNGVAINEVNWGSSGGTLGFPSHRSDGGNCVVLTLGSAAGLYTVTGTVQSFPPVTFSITGT